MRERGSISPRYIHEQHLVMYVIIKRKPSIYVSILLFRVISRTLSFIKSPNPAQIAFTEVTNAHRPLPQPTTGRSPTYKSHFLDLFYTPSFCI